MIIVKTVDGVKYEGVLQGELVATGEVQQFEIVVLDPERKGGRLRAYLSPKNEVPLHHVSIGTLAIK